MKYLKRINESTLSENRMKISFDQTILDISKYYINRIKDPSDDISGIHLNYDENKQALVSYDNSFDVEFPFFVKPHSNTKSKSYYYMSVIMNGDEIEFYDDETGKVLIKVVDDQII